MHVGHVPDSSYCWLGRTDLLVHLKKKKKEKEIKDTKKTRQQQKGGGGGGGANRQVRK